MPRPVYSDRAEARLRRALLHLGELLEEGVVLLEARLGALEGLLGLVGANHLHELAEAVLAKLLRDGVRREGDGVGLVGGVERELLAVGIRVVAPEREVDGVHGNLLVRRAGGGVEALLDAVRVGDDDRRAVVVLGLVERLHGGRGVRAHRDVRHVHVLVLHLHEAEVLLGLDLAGRRELRDRADRRGLGGLAASVGVHLGGHDEDLDVLARGKDVVKPAVADVIRPAVEIDAYVSTNTIYLHARL